MFGKIFLELQTLCEEQGIDVTVVSTLDDGISGRAVNSIICDELAEPVDMSVPEPKNKPHGPRQNSKKGKARKW